jgi:hypothetical protein
VVNWVVVDKEWDAHGRMDGNRAIWYLLGEYEPLIGAVGYKEKLDEKGGEFVSLKKALLEAGAITETKEKVKVSIWRDNWDDLDLIDLFLGYRTITIVTAHKDKIIAFYERDPKLDRPPFLFEGVRLLSENMLTNSWPWGSYETKLLRSLGAAANKLWKNYDPEDPTTAPTNEQVTTWLMEQEGVTERTAEVIATILRADGLPTGPRSFRDMPTASTKTSKK